MSDIEQAITRLAAVFDGAVHLDHAIARGCADGGRYIHGHPNTWWWQRTRDSLDAALARTKGKGVCSET